MYKRKESIQEENLEWGKHTVSPLIEKDEHIKKALVAPVSKQKTIQSDERDELNKKSDVKEESPAFLDKHPKLFFIFTIVFLPYIIGFFLCYLLFYFYTAMPITVFFNMQTGHTIELWSIGIYLFITVGIIWILFSFLFLKER